jgi:hypothetical protein
MNFNEITQAAHKAHKELIKMNVVSLNLFAEVHQLRTDQFKYDIDIKLAQNLLYYLYYNKLCALSAINFPERLTERFIKTQKEFDESTKESVKVINDPNKRGARASLIKQMLLAGKCRMEIKAEVMERFPDTPHANIGCQIAATICFLKKKEALSVNGNETVSV